MCRRRNTCSEPGRSSGHREQVRDAILAVLGLVAGFVFLLQDGLGLFRRLLIGGGLTVAVAAELRLMRGPRTKGVGLALVLVLASGAGIAAWASLPGGPSPADRLRGGDGGPPEVDRGVPVGVRPMALDATSNQLWVLISTGLVMLDPRRPAQPPTTVDTANESFDLAATESVLGLVDRQGWIRFVDTRSRRPIWRPLRLSEAGGHLGAGFGKLWFCNETQSKVNQIDPYERRVRTLAVPGIPTGIAVGGGSIWVSVREGWVVRFDPVTGLRQAVISTAAGPEALAFGHGRVWVLHPDSRVLTRIDAKRNAVTGPPIEVAASTRAIAVTSDSVWALSTAADVIQRVGLEVGKVLERLRVPREPTDVVAVGDRLFVTSALDGTVTWVGPRK